MPKPSDPLAVLSHGPVRVDDPKHLVRTVLALRARMRSLIQQTARWRARALKAEAALAAHTRTRAPHA